MKKNHKRYHMVSNNKVASVYIDEVYLPDGDRFQKFYDGVDTITTCYYEYIGVCVSNSRRTNNDWWRGDKTSDKMYNTSTGNGATFVAIADMLEQHIDEFILRYGYYCCMFEPTDDRRRRVYMRMVKHYCKERGLDWHYVIADDDTLLYWINRC